METIGGSFFFLEVMKRTVGKMFKASLAMVVAWWKDDAVLQRERRWRRRDEER